MDLARFLAFLSQKYPGFARVVERWPNLLDAIKTTIKTLVETASPVEPPESEVKYEQTHLICPPKYDSVSVRG
jgi:hypothetical protein